MDAFVDHYLVLGLASREEGAVLTEKDITKAYKLKAKELHPDKNRDDPNAHGDFVRLLDSYNVLKDEEKRKVFDALLITRRMKRKAEVQGQSVKDSKKRKMRSDFEEREWRYAAAAKKAQKDETARKLKEEIEAIRSKFGQPYPKQNVTSPSPKDGRDAMFKPSDKVLKVSWQSAGQGYTEQKLMSYFSSFGVVEKVVLLDKNKNSAYVVMASRDAFVAITKMAWLGDFSNPLSAKPL